jgi:alcohol dehydrogenase class IV
MRLVKEWLPLACQQGDNIAARAHMMAASTMGAAAFQKGLGAMHAMSHPCGAVLNTHHGLTNAVVMPYVLVFNRSAIDERMTGLARYLDLPQPSFQAVLGWVLALRKEIGIPADLAALGVTEDHIGQLAKMAAVDPSAGSNPLPLTVENLTTLFTHAIHGRLD